MTTNKFRILIVEDKPEELEKAVRIAEELGFEMITGTTARAHKMVCKVNEGSKENSYESSYTPLVDGVVTDIFMPLFEEGDRRHNSDSPCGVLIAAAAVAAKIPCIFCTGGYHHGSKFQWIQCLDRYMDVLMCDSGSDEETDASKNWKEAIGSLKLLLERKLNKENQD